MECRHDDKERKTWFRSDRFFNEGNQWYFATREGTVEGPYESRAEASQELMLYLRNLEAKAGFGIKPAMAIK